MLSAIIVAGGSSRRMGFDKTFALIAGRPVLAHSVAAFEATASVAEIILVGREERLSEMQELIESERYRKVRTVVAGGVHRQDSVRNGLAAVKAASHYVAVHDAARPLVRPEEIERVYQLAQLHGAATLAAPVRDTLKQANAEGQIIGGVARDRLFAVETPQIFERELLLRAYAAIGAEGLSITDETSAVAHLQHVVFLLANEEPNFKITYPADLHLAESVLTRREKVPAQDSRAPGRR